MDKKMIFRNIVMTRRNALSIIGSIFAGTAGLKNITGAKTVKKPSENLPNIIWIISDDVSKPDHGCYGNPVQTPNIDLLADEGVRFTGAFATSPSCSPSRTSMFTGKYCHSAGAENLHDPLPPNQSILPSMLKEKDYFSANCAKLHLGPVGEKQFDKIYKNAEDWKKFANERPEDKPFFLSIGFHEAHRPYKKNLIQNPHSPEKVIVPPYLSDIPEVREDLALYYDEISYMDAEIGRLLKWLDREKLTENTVILYFGDQGMPFPRSKTTLYDSGLCVPLIAKWKGTIPRGIVQDGLASLVDLTPTMLEIAGITPNEDIQGKNIMKMLFDADAEERRYIFGERNWHDNDDHIRCVRSNRYKYIRNYYPDEPFIHAADITRSISCQAMLRLLDEGKLTKQQMLIFRALRPYEELYDLRTDPNEFENLAYRTEYQNALNKMRSELDKWVKETNDVSPEDRMVDQFNHRTGERVIEGRGPLPRK